MIQMQNLINETTVPTRFDLNEYRIFVRLCIPTAYHRSETLTSGRTAMAKFFTCSMNQCRPNITLSRKHSLHLWLNQDI